MNFKKYGVGKTTELKFKTQWGINLKTRTCFLTNSQKTAFNYTNKNFTVGKQLYDKIKADINFYKEIRNNKGIRHTKGLPVRGQRTHTNASPKVSKYPDFW